MEIFKLEPVLISNAKSVLQQKLQLIFNFVRDFIKSHFATSTLFIEKNCLPFLLHKTDFYNHTYNIASCLVS